MDEGELLNRSVLCSYLPFHYIRVIVPPSLKIFDYSKSQINVNVVIKEFLSDKKIKGHLLEYTYDQINSRANYR